MLPSNSKRFDLIVIIGLNLLGFFYAYLTQGTYAGSVLFSVFAVAIPAMIYMAVRKKKDWKKIIVFTLVFGVLYDGFVLELFAEITKSWNVVNLTIPLKALDLIPLDSIIGQGIISTMYVAMFYEHFFHTERSKRISHRIIYAVMLGVIAFLTIYLTYLYDPSRLASISNPYFKIGLLAIIPPILLAFLHPVFFKRMASMGAYFFLLFLLFEIVGVNFGWWVFQGDHYIGWVHVANIRFPFEEIIFWMFFYPATLISFYEVFIDEESCIAVRSSKS